MKNVLKGGVSSVNPTPSSKTMETCSGVTYAFAITEPSSPFVIGIEKSVFVDFDVVPSEDAFVKLDCLIIRFKILRFFSRFSISILCCSICADFSQDFQFLFYVVQFVRKFDL
jgi:hypothetical protein